MAKEHKKPTIKQLKDAGLPIPLSMQQGKHKTTRNAFKAEQKKWYGKLKKEGFKDAEWVDHKTGYGQNSPVMTQWLPRTARGHSFEWYRLCAAYRHHNQNWPNAWDKLIWDLYTEGVSYRKIVSQYNSRQRKKSSKRSLFYIFGRIHYHMDKLRTWHETAKEGLWNEAAEDVVAYDVPIREPEGFSFSRN